MTYWLLVRVVWTSSSIAILLGGLGVLVPEKRDLIGQLGIKAVLAASLSNLMSAALAGIMLTF